jgi:hypothetical protein
MALQIRRGTTAERLAITFLPGEIIFDATLNQVFVGNGTTPGGIPVTAYTDENAVDAIGAALVAGNSTNSNVTFTYGTTQDGANRINASVVLDGGLLNVVEDTTPQLGGDLDLNTNDITGTGDINITGTVTATSFSGPLTGNVTGNVSGTAATVTGAAQTAITSLGTLTSLAVTGAITGSSFTGDITTASITTTSGDLTVTPNTNFSNGIDVTNGASTFKNVTVAGVATVNTVVGSPITVNVNDELTAGARGTGLVIDTKALDFNFSGSGIEFKVNNGTITENLVKVEAYSQSTLSEKPGFNVKVYNSVSESYDVTPLVADGGGVTVNGTINLNNQLFVSTGSAPTSSIGQEGDEEGAVIITNEYIYRCVATWTDASPDPQPDIWVRVAFNATPW